MTTELKLGYADITRRAVLTSVSSEDANYPHQNLFYGGKTIFWQTSAPVTTSWVKFDLDSGITASAEYFMVSGLNSIISQTPGTLTVQLRASTDDFVGSDVLILEDTSIVTADLIGTYSEDLIKTGTLSTAYRYWQIKITTANSVYHKLRSIYLGSFFNFAGRSPKYPYEINPIVSASGFNSDAGTMFVTSSGRARYEGLLNWHGLTDAIRNDFFSKVGQYHADFPIFLYEPDSFGHTIFPNRLLCCYIESSYNSSDIWKDLGTLSLKFVEDITG